MTAPAAAPVAAEPKVLLTSAPEGSEFKSEEVRTAKGTQSLGEVPILVWHNLQKMVEYYSEEGVLSMADGTSLRVSFQNIGRRLRSAGKSDDEIKDAQIRFKPGKRQVGESTPASRAARSAKAAVEKTGNAEAIEKLLAKIASGELSNEDLQALAG